MGMNEFGFGKTQEWRGAMRYGWLLGALAMGMSGCTPFTPDFEKNTADVILHVSQVTGQSGDADFKEAGTLFSDVIICKSGKPCTIVNDNAGLTLTAFAKNPNDSTVGGAFNTITLTNYKVEYTRTDGHNIPGVDVPFAISGPMGIDVSVGGTTTTSIVVVRHTAKEEAPLQAIAGDIETNNGQPNTILVVVAHITVFGTTVNGQGVSTTADLEIHFGDFGNQ